MITLCPYLVEGLDAADTVGRFTEVSELHEEGVLVPSDRVCRPSSAPRVVTRKPAAPPGSRSSRWPRAGQSWRADALPGFLPHQQVGRGQVSGRTERHRGRGQGRGRPGTGGPGAPPAGSDHRATDGRFVVAAREDETGYAGAWSLTAHAVCSDPLPGFGILDSTSGPAARTPRRAPSPSASGRPRCAPTRRPT